MILTGLAPQSPIRWGVIGCGDVCEFKSGPAFSKVPGSELVAVMRRNPDRARDYAERHGVPQWHSDADQLLSDPKIDAIYIATPPSSHAEYTIRAAAAGKAVYVEKPMARTYAECQRMIGACNDAKVPLFVAYYRRSLPSFLHVKHLIEQGAIGEIRHVSISLLKPPDPVDADPDAENWRTNPEIAGGGHFVDLASHQFDYLDFLFGPISTVGGIAANQASLYEAEDSVVAHWQHESGVLGSGTWCFTASADGQREEAEIVGSMGHIRFSFFGDATVYVESTFGNEIIPFEHPAHIQSPLIASVVDSLLGRGQCPSTGVSGSRTTRVMEQILTSNLSV